MDVETRVDRHELSVDAQDTVTKILSSVRVADAPALATVLQMIRQPGGHDPDTSLFVADALTKIDHGDVSPADADGPVCLAIADGMRELERLGYLTVHDLADETSSASYLDEGRSLTAIRVLRPFHTVGVVYRWRRALLGPPDSWDIVTRPGVIWPGVYVRGAVGDYRLRDVGLVYAGPPELDTDALIYAIRDESDVFTCHAVCDSCGADWYADDGSWIFRANRAHADFDYNDARRHDGTTVMCPEPLCVSGRVSFTVG
ncbi:hypothetical protein [Pseudofrankia asymbiotica]|uniref:Uncharacterized protein n=1 Tax=Pseudofrankia asymbiotica TaxID=1834516 RepID=A0A1V2I447_9ACTN|nr:hypothetical protein [Pseudofrankia asymbiotica]ONH25187.1 hypothetical protein BL253_27850 [Pseudofrankia asymbiotica]